MLPKHWERDSIWRATHGHSVEARFGVAQVTSAHIPLEKILLFHVTAREAGMCIVGGEKFLVISW